MDIKNIYKIISYLEWTREDDIFFPSSLFWDNNLLEEDILSMWVKYLRNKNKDQGVGLYIHYPFCSTLCSYCFVDKIQNNIKYKNYLDLIKLESSKFKKVFKNEKIKNIYIWWWTPSLMSVEDINYLFKIISDNFDISNVEQITAELSPSTTTKEKLLAFKNNWLDRLVIWVQSLDDKVLKINNRFQKIDKILDLLNYSHLIWIKNIKVDLIAWLPWETLIGFLNTLDIIKNNKYINELSIYPFCPHENSEYIKNNWIYTDEMVLLRKKMIKEWLEVEKNMNRNNFYNKQILEEEQGKISILWLWAMAVSKVFWQGVYKKEFYEEYEKWLLSWNKISFYWKKYTLDIEIIAYILRNLNYLSFNDFKKTFDFEIEKTFIYKKLLYLIEIWVFELIKSEKDKIIKIINKDQFSKRIYWDFLYPEEYILKFIKLNKVYIKNNFKNIDSMLKRSYDLDFY